MFKALQVNGETIEWKHLLDLYNKLDHMRKSSCGLTLVPKLKREHVNLTSFSRMRVDLATQVITLFSAMYECELIFLVGAK